MIPFEELSAALDAFASNPAQPLMPVVSTPPAPQPVAAYAAPVAAAHDPADEPAPMAPMYDADKSNEIDIGDVLDDETNHS